MSFFVLIRKRNVKGEEEEDDYEGETSPRSLSLLTKLLLARRVPAVEAELAAVGREVERVDLDADGRCDFVFFVSFFFGCPRGLSFLFSFGNAGEPSGAEQK